MTAPRVTPDHIGRIRLNENEARMLYWLVVDERLELLRERKEAQARGEDTNTYQRYIHYLRNIRNEVSLLMEEKGWDIGQLEQSEEEGTDPPSPPREQGGVGGWDATRDGGGRRVGGTATAS